MSDRRTAVFILAAVALVGVACGGPEQSVVDNYFRAVNSEDNQTLSSFAVVNFDQKVDSWKINDVKSEPAKPAMLPGLVAKVDEVQGDLDANKKAYNAYFLDHPSEVDQVRELLKTDAKIPAKLQKYADDWQQFIDKEKELKKALADAKDAVSKERRNVTLSLGQVDNVEKVVGDVQERQVDLTLTIKGEPQHYLMTIRRYEMKPNDKGPRVISRWVVFDLQKA
jgi:hypothetical protein